MTQQSNRGRRLRFVQMGVVAAVIMQLSLAPLASAIMPDLSLLRQNQSSKTPGIETGKKKNFLPVAANTQGVDTKIAGNVSMNNAMATSQEAGDTTPPSNPTASPEAGSYNTSKWVELSSNNDSKFPTEIRYTLDGTDPDKSATLYTTPILVHNTGTTTIKAIAYAAMSASEVVSFVYIIDREDPVIKTVQYYNKAGTEISSDTPTNGEVTVRVTANEQSNITSDPDNTWKEIDDSTFEKIYIQNVTETITVTDKAGNESEPREIAVKGIDTVPPIISFTPQNENNIYNQSVTYTISDNADTEERRSTVTINDLAAPTTGTISSDGTYRITATDPAGNSSTVTIIVDIVVATLSVQPLPTVKPLTSSSIAASLVVTPEVTSSTSPNAVPRADVVQASALIDTSPGKDVALSPSEEGWKLWGIAWYWYGAGAGLLGSSWWLMGRRYFTGGGNEL